MKKKKLPVRWDKFAKEEIKHVISYYKQYSTQGANNVMNDILKAASQLNLFPEKHPVEPVLGLPFRFIAVRDFKLIYYPTTKEIRIVDLFNCNQHPAKITLKIIR